MSNMQIVSRKQEKSRLVRSVLYANALFSVASGAVAIIGAGFLAEFTGINSTVLFVVLGALLIIYAIDLIWIASRESINHRFVWAAILLDSTWVIGSLAILVFGWPPLTTAGKWTVALLAEVVAIMAILQYLGLRRLN